MLEALFGNKTAAFILLFLERNGEAYATEISKGLKIPLNMVQKQLERLKKGGVLEAFHSGRRKIYRLNITSPIYKPLKELLARADALENIDPADGRRFSIEERIKFAEHLNHQATLLNPYKRYRPFAKSFGSFSAYETWRKEQKNPWLV